MLKSNSSYIKARLGSAKLFWKLRDRLFMFNFRRYRGAFGLKMKMDTATAETAAFRVLAQGALASVILAVVAAAALYVFERNIESITSFRIIDDGWLENFLTGEIHKETYTQLLATVAGVTGVFLALYFTAVSTVAANTYSAVPQDIRELLIKDRLGNVYVRAVSFLTAFSVLLLTVRAGGVTPLHLALPIIAALACFAVFAFIRLGQRAFFLSDPTLMSYTLSGEFMKWATRSTAKGWRWTDINFQEHYRKQANKTVSTLTALAKIAEQRSELQGESFPNLVRRLIFTVRLYYSLRSTIPSGSRWYGQRYQHKQWYLTESTELEIATQTDSALRPNEVPDTTWVEDALLGAVLDALESDAQEMKYEALYLKLADASGLFEDMGEQWLVEDGEDWCNKLRDKIVKKIIHQEHDPSVTRPAFTIAVVDICSSLPLSLELGFMKAVRSLNVDKLRRDLSSTNWTKPKAPYQFAMPPNTIKTLEQVYESAKFEQKVHTDHNAPGWFIVELAFNNLEWNIFKQWESLMKLNEQWYFSVGQELSSAGKYMQAAAVYDRALELAWKLDRHVDELKKTSEPLRNGVKLDFKRPEWDWEKAHKRVAAFRDKAINRMSELIPKLLPESPDSDVPDYFGHAVHITGEACYDALVEGNVERFKALFNPYFVGILGAFMKVRPQVLEWETSTALTWLSEPIIDLFEISGYAYIFAEYHSKPELWSECERIWDNWLSGNQRDARLELLADFSYHHQRLFGVLPPRAGLRGNREIRLARLLNGLPRQERTDPFGESITQHPSALIQNIAPMHHDTPMMFTKALDVFTVQYLMAKPEAANLDFGITESNREHIRRDTEVDNE